MPSTYGREGQREEANSPCELEEQALKLLDFPAVRQVVAGYITFGPARRLALAMGPVADAEEVQRLQEETAQARHLLERYGGLEFAWGEEGLAAVERAALGGQLTGPELAAVAGLLDVLARGRRALLRGRAEAPLLARLGQDVPDLRSLRSHISRAVDPRGEVVDDATPALATLRRQVRRAYERAVQALERILRSSAGREALQDDVVTIRNDRLVLQVKAEQRHRIPGIVHGVSNTGATVFVEPYSTVDLCNEWRRLAVEEELEVRRVLRELSEQVGAAAERIRLGVQRLAEADFILARARYAAALRAARPTIADDGGVRLLDARHPLLGEQAVPITLMAGPEKTVLVITGPNTGGKTVAMKTVGLLAIMHQSGLQIPAQEGSRLPVFDGIYADIGDQQSVERSVSTFGSHMKNVIEILAVAGPRSLVLLDELGTSTDPEEGAALAKAILEELARRRVTTVVTTHYRSVAAFAQSAPGMTNASVDLDPKTLRPTYKVTMGVPGRSYATTIAARLGLPPEVLERARGLMEPRHILFEDWLRELQETRQALQERLQEAQEARARAEEEARRLAELRRELEERRGDLLRQARREAEERLREMMKALRRAEAALSWQAPPPEAVAEAQEALRQAQRELARTPRPSPPTPPEEGRGLGPGRRVEVRGLGLRGTIVAISPEEGQAEVNIGRVRLRLDLARLAPVDGGEEEAKPEAITARLGPPVPGPELDLRGLRVEEALAKTEEFLDRALRDGLTTVRIVHGRGSGALRRALREHLAGHALVRSFGPDAPERGGDGATIVELV